MQNTRLIYKNFWRLGEILSATTESAQFPAVYSQDDDTTLAWRSTAIAAAQKLVCDLGEALTYDYIALLGHNLTNAATITVKGADDSAITTNVVTDTLTWAGNNLREYLGTARTKRYVEISVTDAANPAGYVQIGTIVLGKYYDLGVPVSAEGYEDGYDDFTETEYSPSRNLFITQDSPAMKSRSMSWKQIGDTAKGYIVDLLAENGAHYAFELCFDYTTPNSQTWWVVLESVARPQYVHKDYWTWSIEAKEHA